MKNYLVVLSLLGFGLFLMAACTSSSTAVTHYELAPPSSPISSNSNPVSGTVTTLPADSPWSAPVWRWFSGGSDCDCYHVGDDHGVLTLVAGPKTYQWDNTYTAPRMERRMEGAFQVQVRLEFDPMESEQIAGMGLRVPDDQGTWIAVRKSFDGDQQFLALSQSRHGRSEDILKIPFASPVVFINIRRENERLTVAVGETTLNWVVLKNDHTFVLPRVLNVFLYTSSANSHEVSANFSEFNPEAHWVLDFQEPGGDVLLNGDGLAPPWSWFPGGRPANEFKINQTGLLLVAGPLTYWNKVYSAPRLEYPLKGNFQVQTQLDFVPTHAGQSAGLYIRPAEDWDTWIALRAEYDTQHQYVLHAVRNQEGTIDSFATQPYDQSRIHLRIRRTDSLLGFDYSQDGVNWTILYDNFVMALSPNVWVALSVYSNADFGIPATFTNVKAYPLAP